MSTDQVPTKADRPYDIVLFGATGFTGRLTADYMAEHAPVEFRWALAGRNLSKLKGIVTKLADSHPNAPAPDILEADAADATALQKVAESARVVASTVGPFISHGEALVAACAAAGTDYCDITGEAEFVDRSWNLYHAQAQETGARLVHCCGFDSIPHDFGAYFTVKQLPDGVPLQLDGYVRMSSVKMLSGGSFQTAIEMFSRSRSIAAEAKQRAELEDAPPDRRINASPTNLAKQPSIGGWGVPAPTIDGDVIRRSAAAMERYGPNFTYGHNMLMPNLPSVIAMGGVVATIATLAKLPPTRRLVRKLKAAGTGPDEQARNESSFTITFVGEGGGQRVVTEVSGGDPATTETAKMLSESAFCLAFDNLPTRSGQLTPVAAMGDALLARIRAAGIRFEAMAKPHSLT